MTLSLDSVSIMGTVEQIKTEQALVSLETKMEEEALAAYLVRSSVFSLRHNRSSDKLRWRGKSWLHICYRHLSSPLDIIDHQIGQGRG